MASDQPVHRFRRNTERKGAYIVYFSHIYIICDRLWDFGPYGGTWAKLGFLYNLKCSPVLRILVNFQVCFHNNFEVMSFQVMQPPVVL